MTWAHRPATELIVISGTYVVLEVGQHDSGGFPAAQQGSCDAINTRTDTEEADGPGQGAADLQSVIGLGFAPKQRAPLDKVLTPGTHGPSLRSFITFLSPLP